MSAWQPIETAPKDGTKIDVWAITYRLVNTATGETQKVGRRFTGAWWAQGQMVQQATIPNSQRQSQSQSQSFQYQDIERTGWHCEGWSLTGDWVPVNWMSIPEPPAAS